MTIINNHGTWSLYRPRLLPPGAPGNALFAKRDNDNVDWYDYIRKDKAFKEGNVVMTIGTDEYGMHVNAANFDSSRIFPAGQLVLEVEYDGEDPQKYFGDRMYDPETKEFKDVTFSELVLRPKNATD